MIAQHNLRVALFLIGLVPEGVAAAAIELPPEDVLLAIRKARTHQAAGRVVEERAVLEQLVESHPSDTTSLLQLFDFYSRHADKDNIARLRALLRAQLANAEQIPLSLLKAAIQDKRMDEQEVRLMLAELEKRFAAEPSDTSIPRMLLTGYERLDDPGKQREQIVRLLALEPSARWKFELIRIDESLGRWEDLLAEVRAIKPGNAEAGWLLLRELAALDALNRVGEMALIIDRLEVTAATAESVVDELMARAMGLLDRGDTASAEKLLRKLALAQPQKRELGRAVAYLFGTLEEQASLEASYMDKTLKSDNLETLINDAARRMMNGDAASAIPILERAAVVAPKSELPWFNLAVAATKLERWPLVESAAGKAIEINAAQPRALMLRAQARVKSGRVAEGMADAKAALAIDPKLKQAWYVLYLGANRLHDEKAAAEYLEKSR